MSIPSWLGADEAPIEAIAIYTLVEHIAIATHLHMQIGKYS